MKKNIGTLDRLLRIGLAVAVGVLYAFGFIEGPLAIALGVLAVVLVATSAVAVCPLYLPFGLSTLRGGNKLKP